MEDPRGLRPNRVGPRAYEPPPDRVIQRRPQPKSGYRPKPNGVRRGPPKPVDGAERAAICALILDGNSIAQVSALTGRSTQTIMKALATENVRTLHPTPEASRAAIADYSMARRQVLINILFDKIERVVEAIETEDRGAARDIKDLAIAAGIMIDKRRLEDGEVTSRSESGPIGEARVTLATKLDAIVRNRDTSKGMATYEVVDDTQKTPGELVELEKEPVYTDEDEDAKVQRPSQWGLVGE
jgi:hypothetical protein